MIAVGLVVALLGTIGAGGVAGPARSVALHASDPDALTVDLIFDTRGLVLIDAAANRGGVALVNGQRPKRRERAAIARGVVAGLAIPRERAAVDPRTSLLYHEVGFTVYLVPFSTGSAAEPEMSFGSGALQDVAERHEIATLKVEVCAAEDRLGPVAQLQIGSSSPGLLVAPATDRDCTAWVLSATDPPVTVTVRPQPA